MRKNKFIRNITGWSLLFLFAISITPRQFLHDLVTHHKHTYDYSKHALSLQTARNNFQCFWSEQPVKSPFTDKVDMPQVKSSRLFIVHISRYIAHTYFGYFLFASLRAPPALA